MANKTIKQNHFNRSHKKKVVPSIGNRYGERAIDQDTLIKLMQEKFTLNNTSESNEIKKILEQREEELHDPVQLENLDNLPETEFVIVPSHRISPEETRNSKIDKTIGNIQNVL